MKQPVLVGNRTVGCRRQNCTRHPWFLYQPVPGWTLPHDEWGLKQVRACTVTADDFHRQPRSPAALCNGVISSAVGAGTSGHEAGHSAARASVLSGSTQADSSAPAPLQMQPRCDSLQALYWRSHEV